MDERLRELERRAAFGDEVARVRWFRELAREGSRTVEVAARRGDPDALEALESGEPCDLSEWLDALEGAAQAARVRAALEAATVALRTWADGRVRAAVRQTRAWLECPCLQHVELAASSGGGALQVAREAVWATRFISDETRVHLLQVPQMLATVSLARAAAWLTRSVESPAAHVPARAIHESARTLEHLTLDVGEVRSAVLRALE